MAKKILVRATVNLPGLKVGQFANVDPDDPYIADCLRTELVVPVLDGEQQS